MTSRVKRIASSGRLPKRRERIRERKRERDREGERGRDIKGRKRRWRGEDQRDVEVARGGGCAGSGSYSGGGSSANTVTPAKTLQSH